MKREILIYFAGGTDSHRIYRVPRKVQRKKRDAIRQKRRKNEREKKNANDEAKRMEKSPEHLCFRNASNDESIYWRRVREPYVRTQCFFPFAMISTCNAKEGQKWICRTKVKRHTNVNEEKNDETHWMEHPNANANILFLIFSKGFILMQALLRTTERFALIRCCASLVSSLRHK